MKAKKSQYNVGDSVVCIRNAGWCFTPNAPHHSNSYVVLGFIPTERKWRVWHEYRSSKETMTTEMRLSTSQLDDIFKRAKDVCDIRYTFFGEDGRVRKHEVRKGSLLKAS